MTGALFAGVPITITAVVDGGAAVRPAGAVTVTGAAAVEDHHPTSNSPNARNKPAVVDERRASRRVRELMEQMRTRQEARKWVQQVAPVSL